MLSPAVLAIVVFVLSALSVGGLLVAVLNPRVVARSTLDQRLALISVPAPTSRNADVVDEGRRKRSVEETLREADAKLRAKAKRSAKPSLKIRMRQAEIRWSKTTYYMICVVAATAAFGFFLLVAGLSWLPSAGFGVSLGLLLPHLYVNFMRNRRFKRFSAEFPNAVDVIVRGVKSGLPLIDCLRIISTEAAQPVSGEFRTLIEDQTLGMPLEEAVQRLHERIPLAEASFFAIVIAIQSRTGGSLSEALGNLSKVLRERKKMRAKIKAMSSEAKASGGIIGSLPIIVGTLVYLSSPDYISLLFTNQTGNIVMVGSALWMATGIFVMKKMINFNI